METVMSREVQLLLAFARIDLGEGHRIAIERLLHEGVDWGQVVEIARRNEVTPFLYHHMRNMTAEDRVPAGLLTSLERFYHANAYRNVKLLDALGRVLGALKEAGIDAIVLKGGALLSDVYRGIPLRTMADIDLLVPVGDICERAKEVLFEIGYDYHRSHGSYWVGAESRFRIELLTRIMTAHLPFFLHEDGRLWARAERREIAGIDALVLCPEDFLLHLCIHATYRHFFRLKFFIDIAEFIRAFGEELRWEELIWWDSNYPIGNHMYTAFTLCRRLLGVPIPEWVMVEIRKQSPTVLTRHLYNINLASLVQQRGQENLQSGILYLMASKTAAERARYLGEILFLPKNKMSILHGAPVSSWKLYIHYLLRPLHLFLKDSLPAMKFVMRR